MKITKDDLRDELIKRLRGGTNLLQAEIGVQHELLDMLREASREIVKLHEEGKLK